MKTNRSILIPLAWHSGERYDICRDAVLFGEWQLCVRLRLGWPLIRWGWRFNKRESIGRVH